MHQHERINAALGNQPRGHHSFAKRGGGCQHSRVLSKHGLGGDNLLGSQFTLECRLQRLARVALVPDHCFDVQIRQRSEQVIQAAARQSNVAWMIFSASDNSGLVVRREPHGLSLVEFGILESRQPDQAVAEGRKQYFFRDIYLIGDREFQGFWKGTSD